MITTTCGNCGNGFSYSYVTGRPREVCDVCRSAVKVRYEGTSKAQLRAARYRATPKGVAAHRRRAHRRRKRSTNPEAYIARLDQMLRNDEPCNHCGLTAEQIDHILPLALGGTDDRDNLQALCKPCHKIKTAQDVRNIHRSKQIGPR